MDQKIDPSSDKSSKNFDARSQISLQKGPKTIPFCTKWLRLKSQRSCPKMWAAPLDYRVKLPF